MKYLKAALFVLATMGIIDMWFAINAALWEKSHLLVIATGIIFATTIYEWFCGLLDDFSPH